MGEKFIPEAMEAAKNEYEELNEKDLIEVDGSEHPVFDNKKETSGVRRREDIEGSEQLRVFKVLDEKVGTFAKAVESSQGRNKDILQDKLKELVDERQEVARNLKDNEMVSVGLGQQRAEELKAMANGLLQEYGDGNKLQENQKEILEGKIVNITERMKKIVDGFDEEQKENFTINLSSGQIKDLGLERQALRRLDRTVKSHDTILKDGKPANRKKVKDNRNKLTEERKEIWENMSDEEVRDKYGIKTQEEFIGEQNKMTKEEIENKILELKEEHLKTKEDARKSEIVSEIARLRGKMDEAA